MTFHEYEIKRDPVNEITWENRDAIEIVETEETCPSSTANHPPTAS